MSQTNQEPGTPQIRVVVVDPDPLAGLAIAQMLEASGRFVVIETTTDGTSALATAVDERPDILLVAAATAKIDGVELTHRLTAEAPSVRVVVLTVTQDDELAINALRAGASGVLSKETIDGQSLLKSLQLVYSGEVAVARTVTRRLVEQLRRVPEPGNGLRPIGGPLTSREWEVLDYLANDASTQEIADALHLTNDTVYTHVKHLMRKLDARTREEAVEAAQHLFGYAAS